MASRRSDLRTVGNRELNFTLAWMVLALTGCHQTGVYHASSLPPELTAPRTSNMQNVDLSRFARSISNSELLYPGDVVDVTIATGLEEEVPHWKLRISEDGKINVPLVGGVDVAGLRLAQAENVIHTESVRRGAFVNPNVVVLLEKRRSNRVTVLGAVKEPGTYEVPAANSDVLSAVVMAGGMTEESGTIIEVRHPQQPSGSAITEFAGSGAGSAQLAAYPHTGQAAMFPRTARINLEEDGRASTADLHLEDGSTVVIMKRPQRFIHVIGLVRKSDQYEIPPDQELRLLDAIALAGGRTLEIADEVHVIRNLPGDQQPRIIQASVRQAKRNGTANIRLTGGDVISVEETPATFVVGTLRDFVRFGFTSAIPGF